MTDRVLIFIMGLLILLFGVACYWAGKLDGEADMIAAFESFGCFLEKE